MSKSIISNEKRCLVCGSTINLHKHHIFHGTANRKLSEKHGCWCYLCARHHNMSPHSVHADHNMDIRLKIRCQEALGWSGDKMIEVFGRTYV